MLQERGFFDEVSESLSKYIPEYKKNILLIMGHMEKLRDGYHAEKEAIKLDRAAIEDKRFTLKRSGKTPWISRLVLRLRKKAVTDKKKLSEFDAGNFYELQFFRSVGNKRFEYILRKQDSTFSFKGISSARQNGVTEEELEMLEYYVREVNLYNQKMNKLKASYLQHIETLKSFRDPF